jgi:hypothetical protein
VNLPLLAPVSLALLGIGAGWFLPRYLRPKAATQLLTAAIVVTTVAIVAALLQVAAAGASEVPAVADLLGWCRALYSGQHGAAPGVGIGAAVILAGIGVGAGRHHRTIRRELATFAEVDGVEVVDLQGPVAFAVPGHPGGIVLGAGLLAELDGEERCAVLAHENAHLVLHHHRYVHTAELCAAGLPFLKPLASRVRYMTERWADEVAAETIGSRHLLASTIARVALMPPGPAISAPLWFGGGGSGTLGRVDELLNPQSSPILIAAGSAAVVLLAVSLGSAVQLHHLVTFFAHICPI